MTAFQPIFVCLMPCYASASMAPFERVADYLEKHPDSTLESIDAACDVGSTYQVLATMPSRGYGISSRWCWRDVVCDGGQRSRKVQTYALTHRPGPESLLQLRVWPCQQKPLA